MQMEFRNPYPYEDTSIKELWKICFGDPDSYIDFYMEHGYDRENTFVCLWKDKIVSMITLMPAKLTGSSTTFSGGYVYAVATHPQHQHLGYMRKLEAFVTAKARERNFSFLSLVPAATSLFQMYESIGYQVYSQLSRYQYIRNWVPSAPQSRQFSIESINQEEFLKMREKWLKTFSQSLDLSNAPRRYSFDEMKQTGCQIVSVTHGPHTGYLVYYSENDQAFIRETGMDFSFFQEALSALFCHINRPVLYGNGGVGWNPAQHDFVPYSMIKLLDQNIPLCSFPCSYSNLMLD